ncbi:DUF1015 domain-containing protein, partial [archaeon]|nr:DUF1015 domain-containing protein [archaeon]
GRQLPKDSKTDNRYTRARDFYKQWIREGVLIEDKEPSLYYHEHTYSLGDHTHTRRGIIASVHLEDDDKKNIRPHEYTQKGPKLDRLRLMNEVRMNFSSVFGIYSDPKKTIEVKIRPSLGAPDVEFDLQKETHRLWIISDVRVIDQIIKLILNRKILIADGHHRYETARTYRDRMRAATGKNDGNQSFDFIQMYLSNKDEGMTILPSHRVVPDSMGVGLVDLEYRIKEIFNMIPYDNKKTFLAALSKGGRGTLGLYVKGIPRFYLLELTGDADLNSFMPPSTHPLLRALDVTVLHECILEPILGISHAISGSRLIYTNNAEHALSLVTKEKADIAFLLNPSNIEDILEIAEAGLKMPQESTSFHPRTPAGLVFHSLE